MLKITYSLKNLAPVTFTEKSGDGVLYATKRYVPGSALRGALAALYIRKNNLKDAHLDPDFYALFLSGKVRYLPAYPDAEGHEGNTFVIPLSLAVSKDGESVKDYSIGTTKEAGYKKLTGFAIMENTEKGDFLHPVSANVQIEFHMSRNEETERILGSSKKGHVFNYEYLEPYQSFSGSIILDDDCQALVPKLEELCSEKLHLGRSRNAQYGTCRVTLGSKQAVAAEVPALAEKYYLYAHTEYIPYYSWQRVDVAAKEIFSSLEHALAHRGHKVSFTPLTVDTYAGVTEVDSYVGVWKLKRERKNAVAVGSLLGFKAEGMTKEAWQTLAEILLAGLGERITEGYGQFRLWKPLEKVSKSELEAKELTAVKLSEEIKVRAKAIIEKNIIEEIHKQAKIDADALKNVAQYKGTLKKIEQMMDSKETRAILSARVNNELREYAKQNLGSIKINGTTILKYLTDKGSMAMPYEDIKNKWYQYLGFESEKDKVDLEKDLEIVGSPVSEDDIFREYWLWLARFASKSVDTEQEGEE